MADGIAHVIFVLVILRAVDVAISSRESGEAGLNTFLWRGFICAESEAGDFTCDVAKGERGCCDERAGMISDFNSRKQFEPTVPSLTVITTVPLVYY